MSGWGESSDSSKNQQTSNDASASNSKGSGGQWANLLPLVASLGSGAAGGKGDSGQASVPSWYSKTAGSLSTDANRALKLGTNKFDFAFDDQGNLIDTNYGNLGGRGQTTHWIDDPNGSGKIQVPRNPGKEISANEKALYESMNFFSNLYNNKDINAAFEEQRMRLNRDPATGLVSDPAFNIIRERGTAASIEAGRRLGGLRSTGTGRGVADFLTTAEAQQRTYEDERAANAAQQLFSMSFQRGQGGMIPEQTLGSVIAGLGGSSPILPAPSYDNTKGASGQASASWLGKYLDSRQTA